MSSSYPLNPVPGIATAVSVSPATATIALGGTQQLTVTLTDAYGNTVEPSQSLTWSSSNTGLATVDSSGLVTAASSVPNTMQEGGQVIVTVSYPWASSPSENGGTISAESVLTITVPPSDFCTIWGLYPSDGINAGIAQLGNKVVPSS